jgi:hypothetical protein
VEQKYKK